MTNRAVRTTESWFRFWGRMLSGFRAPMLLLSGALAFGTIGYAVIEGWSLFDALYMAVTTLTTVGFREVQPLSTSGRAFTVLLILTGVLGVFTTIAIVAQHIMSGDFGESLRRRRMQQRIDSLRDHYIICAYGRVGRAAAEELAEHGEPYVIVEAQGDLERLLEQHGAPYIVADPSVEAILEQAGIARAKGLISAVDSDAINVYITLTARTMNPDLYIVARSSSPESVDQLYRAGAKRVVSPYKLSGKQMASLAVHQSVVEFVDLARVAPDMRLEEIEVGQGSALDGRTIGAASADRQDIMLLAVKKAGAAFVPSPPPDLVLGVGDLVVALGPAKVLGELSSTPKEAR